MDSSLGRTFLCVGAGRLVQGRSPPVIWTRINTIGETSQVMSMNVQIGEVTYMIRIMRSFQIVKSWRWESGYMEGGDCRIMPCQRCRPTPAAAIRGSHPKQATREGGGWKTSSVFAEAWWRWWCWDNSLSGNWTETKEQLSSRKKNKLRLQVINWMMENSDHKWRQKQQGQTEPNHTKKQLEPKMKKNEKLKRQSRTTSKRRSTGY